MGRSLGVSRKHISNLIIYLYILFIPFSWMNIGGGSFYRFFMIAMLVIYILSNRGRIPYSLDNKKMIGAWLSYFGYQVVSIVWAINKSAAINNVFTVVLMSSLLVICIGNKEVESRRLENCWITVGIVAALLFIFGTRGQVGYSERQTLILLGTKTDANEFAGLFCVTIPFTICRLRSADKGFEKVLMSICILVELYVVLMTGSRGALLAIIIGMGIILLRSNFTITRLFLLTVIAIISYFILIRVIIPLVPSSTISRYSLMSLIGDQGTGRADIWRQGFTNYLKGSVIHVLLGPGTDGVSSYVFGKYTSTMHNTPLQVLVNYGIIGFLLFMTFLCRITKKIIKMDDCYFGAFIGIFTMSLTISMPCRYKPFWVLVITASLLQVKQIEGELNNEGSIYYNN